MDEFKKREKSREAHFVKEQEALFKARARRNKLLGMWAGKQLGLSDAKMQDYAEKLIHLDVSETGEEALFGKIRADFDAANVEQSDHQIRRTMADLLETAKQQLADEASS